MERMDAQKARRLLRPLRYGEWLEAGLAMPPKSLIRHSIRSLEQLAWLFRPVSSAYPSVDLERMREWVAETVGDRELAERIDEVLRRQEGYKQRCLALHNLIQSRCEALRRRAEEEA